jgi:alkanesulfonate monooxygenase SsuD/methylene tetrahydromethanopterin reductase-like flavin-dependent oxidoreductase (luciferase family)
MWTAITADAAGGRRVLEDLLAPMLGRPVDDLAGMLLVGEESAIADRIAAYQEAGVELLVLWPVVDEIGQLERFAERIAPRFSAG